MIARLRKLETAVSDLSQWRRDVLPTNTRSPVQEKGRERLFANLNDYFNMEDIEALCFALGVDFEGLGGDSKGDKIRELLFLMFREHRTIELLRHLKRERPDLEWI